MPNQLAMEQTSAVGRDLAYTDPLTGLGNLRRFFDKVDRLIIERSEDPAPFAIGILDLDGFKPINDLFGRKAGDDILQQVAMRLKAAMDPHSTVSRVGADEFAFLFPMIFSEEAVLDRTNMLIEILSAPYDVGNRTARLSASVGCSLLFSGEENTETLVSKVGTEEIGTVPQSLESRTHTSQNDKIPRTLGYEIEKLLSRYSRKMDHKAQKKDEKFQN